MKTLLLGLIVTLFFAIFAAVSMAGAIGVELVNWAESRRRARVR